MMKPVEMMIKNMIQQSGGNMQSMAQNILCNNPDFANAIQGQNLQQMAISKMAQNGMNPKMFMDNMFGQR